MRYQVRFKGQPLPVATWKLGSEDVKITSRRSVETVDQIAKITFKDASIDGIFQQHLLP